MSQQDHREVRRQRVSDALAAYREEDDFPMQNLADLLADLRHHAAENDLDFADAERLSEMHFRDDRCEVIARAREMYAEPSSDDIEVHDNAKTTRSGDDGTWVAGWLFVRDEEVQS